MNRKLAGLVVAVTIAIGTLPGGIASAGTCPVPLPQGSDPANLDPANFVAQIDNPYLPWAVGSRWVYRESDPTGNAVKVKVTVTTHTRQILGIAATVVHDALRDHGDLVENTFDWYGQDMCGNVWYMG